MQRYRVNYTLLVGILVGAVVGSGAIYGIWRWRMTDNADSLRDRATAAEESGELKEAIGLYNTYLDFRPNDQPARIKQAMLYVDYAKQLLDEKEYHEFGKVRNVISDALFKFTNEQELRRHYVDLLCLPSLERWFAKDALDHLKVLLIKNPDDVELLERQARCLVYTKQAADAVDVYYRLVGYNPETQEFSKDKALAPDHILDYHQLANALHWDLERPDQALKTEEQMVAVNPDSAEAHRLYGVFLGMVDEGAGSKKDFSQKSSDELKKAYELDPTNPQVLLSLADAALRDDDTELAAKYLQEGLDSDTELALFYAQLAAIESKKNNYPAAIAQIDLGLTKVKEEEKPLLMLSKIDVLIDSGNITGAESAVREFESQFAMQNPKVELQKARILAAKNQWLEASRSLEVVRDKLMDNPNLQVQADLLLGLAYEKIGYQEKALEVFERLVRLNPNNKQLQRMYADLKSRVLGGEVAAGSTGSFTDALREMLSKPEEEQDWKAFNKFLDEWCKEYERTDVQRKLLEAQVLVSRKMYAEARDKIREAYVLAKDDIAVQRAAVRLIAADPDHGPDDALKMLDGTVKRFGDQRLLRLDRADLYMARNSETLADELLSLTEGIDDWAQSDQVELWKGIATRLNRAKLREEAEAAWRKVAEMSPNDLPSLMEVFDMAADRNDDAAMQAAQEKILESVGSKRDPSYAFTEAARNYSLYIKDPTNDKLRDAIFKAVDLTLEGRPDWDKPYLLRATVKMQDRDFLGALADFKIGFEKGRGNGRALAQYVKLLKAQGNYKEALKQLEPYDPSICVLLVGRDYPTLLISAGKFRDAAEAAERLASSESAQQSAGVQLWYGQFLEGIARLGMAPEDLRQECSQKASEALTKAVELGPDTPGNWQAYINNMLASSMRDQAKVAQLTKEKAPAAKIDPLQADAAEKRSNAENALRKAQLTLEEDTQSMLVAQSYENMGRWFDAENTYKLARDQQPDSSKLARQMALFYMSGRYPLPDGNRKAVQLINSILVGYDKDPEAVSKQNANWARRVAARMFASTGDYQDSLKAEKLLASNAENKTLSIEDKLEMAGLLAQRPEPVSRNKAIRLLEEVQSQQQLSPETDLTLGKLYYAVGKWAKCRDHMATVRTRYPDSLAVRDAYIRMLLDRGGASDLRAAEDQLRRMQEMAPKSLATLELSSLVYDRLGETKKAQQALRSMLPDMNKLDENNYRLVARVAQLLLAMDDTDTAEKLLTALVNRPGATLGQQLQFAQFIGVHRDADRAFQMLDEMAKDDTLVAVSESGINILRAIRKDVGDNYDAKITGWLTRADREDPGAIPVLMAYGNLYEVQGDYENAAATYRTILAKDRLQGRNKAAILNNLSYLLALGAAKEQTNGEAVKLLNEATEILGPLSDVLDTRAVIWINRGEYQKAVDDMQYAVTDGPTGSKYFHKALAHMGLKQNSETLAAWEKAEDLGLTRDTVGRLEQDKYDELAAYIKKLKDRTGEL